MDLTPLLMLLGLGALHGINPGMGWLFAVGLGFQRQERAAVWRALGPLALGHALAVGLAIAVVLTVGRALPAEGVKVVVSVALIGTGLYRLVRHRHPRYGGMQMTARQLTGWSFLMASGHGAGLMVLPFLGDTAASGTSAHHGHTLAAVLPPLVDLAGILAAAVHTAGYLLVTGGVALLVYDRLGLRFLRKAWINVDLIWSVGLIATGLGTALA